MKTDLEDRTKAFAVQVVKEVLGFPKSVAGDVLGRQLLKSATSIGANYREANRAQSKDDFVHKVGIAEKEASETQYWLEICDEAGLGTSSSIRSLEQEAGELLAILLTIGKNVRNR